MSDWLLHGIFALGGGLGAVLRYVLTTAITHRFPLSTLLVNVAGCYLLGLALVWFGETPGLAGEEARRLFAGFCGGFTTYSSFAYQSLDLRRNHSLRSAALNVLVSLALCVTAFLAGRATGSGLA